MNNINFEVHEFLNKNLIKPKIYLVYKFRSRFRVTVRIGSRGENTQAGEGHNNDGISINRSTITLI